MGQVHQSIYLWAYFKDQRSISDDNGDSSTSKFSSTILQKLPFSLKPYMMESLNKKSPNLQGCVILRTFSSFSNTLVENLAFAHHLLKYTHCVLSL